MVDAQPDYYNFAEARRHLWAAWKDVKCLDDDDLYDDDSDSDSEDAEPTCFHYVHHHLLEDLQKHAHIEVRAGVLLAVGRRLPVELTDEIFEYALAAECLPAKWEVFHYDGMHRREDLRDEYKCDLDK